MRDARDGRFRGISPHYHFLRMIILLLWCNPFESPCPSWLLPGFRQPPRCRLRDRIQSRSKACERTEHASIVGIERLDVTCRSSYSEDLVQTTDVAVVRIRDGNGGHPPCRRCLREQRECILCPQSRGGQRGGRAKAVHRVVPSSVGSNTAGDTRPVEGETQLQNLDLDGIFWSSSAQPRQSLTNDLHSRNPSKTTISPQRSSTIETDNLANSIASADLQNPSDAFNILAQVAHSAEDQNSSESDPGDAQDEVGVPQNTAMFAHPPRSPKDSGMMESLFHYKPITDGLVSCETVQELFARFVEHCLNMDATSADLAYLKFRAELSSILSDSTSRCF